MYKIKKKFLIIGIIVLCGLFILIKWHTKNEYMNNIEDIVVNCVKNNADNKFINAEDSQEIYDSIQSNWDEEGGVRLEKVSCSCESVNWGKQYVCVRVDYKGILKNNEEIEECEYYKIYFKTEKGEVYIVRVDVSVGETGIYK